VAGVGAERTQALAQLFDAHGVDCPSKLNTPRAAFGVTPQGAMRVARQSRFHRILGLGISRQRALMSPSTCAG